MGKRSARLVLLRHGESLWNREGRFTGWMDIDLSEKGRLEARDAGRLMQNSEFIFDLAYTSVLKRAIRTLWIVLEEMDLMWIPTYPSWRLNERFYGDLQGRKKLVMEEIYGIEQVHRWRRGFREHPPAMPVGDERFLWLDQIAAELKRGKNILVVSHGNTIRALVKHIENISDQDIELVEVPTAVPLVYELDDSLQNISREEFGRVGDDIYS